MEVLLFNSSAVMEYDGALLRNQVDVFVAGNGGAADGNTTFNAAAWDIICDFVSVGGGIVFHSWVTYLDGEQNMVLMEKCAPFRMLGSQQEWCINGDKPSLFMNLSTDHWITTGIPYLYSDDLTKWATYARGLAPGAVGLVQSSSSGSCQDSDYLPSTAVSYLTYGFGRSVHLGIGYSEVPTQYTDNVRTPGSPADRLLRQAIAWVAPSSVSGQGTTGGSGGDPSHGTPQFAFTLLGLLCFFLF